MFKVNLKQELIKSKETSKAQQEDAVKEVLQLTNGDHQDELMILRKAFSSSENVKAEKELGALIELKNLEKLHAGTVVTIETIKDLAIKYRLRFLNSRHFKGSIDQSALFSLRKQLKEMDLLNEATLPYKIYVLAPAAMFQLKEERLQSKPKDPVLFVELGNGHYVVGPSWGKDFTIFRQIQGWKWKDAFNLQVFAWFKYFAIFSFFAPFITPLYLGFAAAFVAAGINSILLGITINDTSNSHMWFSERNWREDTIVSRW